MFKLLFCKLFYVCVQVMDEKEVMEMKVNLEFKGEVEFYICIFEKNVKIIIKMVVINKEKKKEYQRVFILFVIELFFGIGRIIYCLYEYFFYIRLSKVGDEQFNMFRFFLLVVLIKCIVFFFVQNQQYEEVVKRIVKLLIVVGIFYKIDIIGKRLFYSRFFFFYV